MDSLPSVWEAFSQMTDPQESSRAEEGFADFKPERKSLLPPPLRLTPRPPPSSPPTSPSPTVFVSLHYLEPSRLPSAQVSLHEYRKNLSSPHAAPETTPAAERTLKRKPKASDLHTLHTGPVSPSLPPSPAPSSSSSSQRSESSSPRCLSPVTVTSAGQDVIASFTSPQPTIAAADAEKGPESTQEIGHAISPELGDARPCQRRKLVSKQFPLLLIRKSLPLHPPRPCHVDRPRQKAFRDYLRQIPTRLIHHNKSPSDSSTLHPRPTKRILHHRGVSFEILSPRGKFGTLDPYHAGIDAPASRSFAQHELSDASTMAYSFSPVSACAPHTTAEMPTRRPTPVRALFEDLPTAYSSITSRKNVSGRRTATDPELDNKRPRYLPSKPLPKWSNTQRGRHNRQGSFATSSQTQSIFGDPCNAFSCEPARTTTKVWSDGPGEVMSTSPESSPFSRNTIFREPKTLRWYLRSRFDRPRQYQDIYRRRRHAKLVKKRPSSKPKRPKLSPAHRRRSAICPGVRPMLKGLLGRRQTSPHSVGWRIGKPEAIDMARRREHKSARHTKVVDGYIYNTKQDHSIPEHEVDEVAPTTIDAQEKSIQKDPVSTSTLKDLDNSRPRLPRLQTHIPTHSTCPRPSHTDYQKYSVSTPNLSQQVGPTISPIETSFDNSRSASPVSPVTEEREPKAPHENEPPVPCPYNLCRPTIDCIEDIVDHYYDEPNCSTGNMQDRGPGSSQTTSTTGLSQHTVSSGALRSRMQLPAATPSRSIESESFSQPSLMVSPLIAAQRGHNRATCTQLQDTTSLADLREMDNEENAGYDDDLDWETVTGSQQFGSTNHIGLIHTDSGSSLANYSTFGSLANKELGSFASMGAPSRFRDYLNVSSPLQNETTVQGQSRSQNPISSHPRDEQTTPKPLSDSIPSLPASTRKYPVPIPPPSSLYCHPSPLSEAHAHPFRSSPPPLLTDQPDQSKASRSGPIATALRSSKSDFHDLKVQTERDSSAVVDQQTHDHAESPTLSYPYPNCQYGIYSQAHNLYFQSEHISYSRNAQISYDGQSFYHSRTPSSQRTVSPTATNELKADDKSYEDPMPVDEDAVALNSRRSASRSRAEPNEFRRHDDSARSESTEPLLNDAPSRKLAPGSLYLSIRSAGSQGARSSSRRSQLSSRRVTFSGPALTKPSPIKESRFSSPYANASGSPKNEHRAGHRKSTSARSLRSPSKVGTPRAVRNSRHSRTSISRNRNNTVRERFGRLDSADLTEFASRRSGSRSSRQPTAIPLSSLPPQVRESISAGNSHTFASAGTLAASSTAFSITSPGWDDEESTLAPSAWYCSADGQYVFSEPPRLVQAHERRSLHATTEYLAAQRRLGKQLILITSLALPPLSWVAVILIGFGEDRADVLMRWRSGGKVFTFHDRERRLARALGITYTLVVFLAAVAISAVVLTVL